MKTKILISLLTITFAFSSCEKWLNVSDNTVITAKEQLTDQAGFMDATIGVYISMGSNELYAKELTWHFVEYLSQQYAIVSGSPDLNIPKYSFESSNVKPYQTSIWISAYNVISNINFILENIDDKKDVLHPAIYNIIKGEMLALRAFLHFDLMRLYGYGNLAERPELMKRYAIPYKRRFNKNITSQLTYEETLKLLNKDIADAVELLKMDPITDNYSSDFYGSVVNSPFVTNRKYRMNYFAAKTLQARIALWQGTPEMKELAIEATEEAINSKKYTWVKESSLSESDKDNDYLFQSEHLFALNIENFADIVNPWLDAQNPGTKYAVIFLTEERIKTIYEVNEGIGLSDWRKRFCFKGQGPTLKNFALRKLEQFEDSKYIDNFPLIRITEAFYIAAECYATGKNPNLSKAIGYLKTVRENRGIAIPLDDNLSLDQLKEEITKEYQKEFVGEGQLFYYYKRIGMKKILGHSGEMTDEKYRFPYPDDERINGNIID